MATAVLCSFGFLHHGTAHATTVVAWGDNTYGQTNTPPGLSNAVAIAQGGYHGLALLPDGTVVAWGSNTNPFTQTYVGQATVPVGLSNVVSIAAGYDSSVSLRRDGTVVVWGDSGQTNPPAGLTNVMAISAGEFHSLAMRTDGTVTAWGGNTYGQTNVPTGLSNVVGIAAGGTDSVVIRSNGTVLVWGWNGYNQTNVPASATNVVAAAAGLYHILALKANGTVVGWGYNGYGQTTIPANLSNVVAIAAGWHHSLALKADGGVVAWGYNNSGQSSVPVWLTNGVGIAAFRHQSLALANDGSPFIVSPPRDQTIFSGTGASFAVTAVGKPVLKYQWQFNGGEITGATNTTLQLTNVATSGAGSYSVVVTNAYGAATSAPSFLNVVLAAPIFVNQPTNQVVAPGSNATFAVTTTGSLPMTFQWRLNDADISGATNAVLTRSNLQWSGEGYYSVLASNAYGSTLSSNAYLNVADLAEALDATNLTWTTSGSAVWYAQANVTHDGVAAARSGTIAAGQQSAVQTTVTGPGTLRYWWKFSAGFLDTLSQAANAVTQNILFGESDWQYRTNYLGAGSQTIKWTHTRSSFGGGGGQNTAWVDEVSFTPGATPPTFSSPPINQSVAAGTTATFRTTAVGTPTLRYQWRFGGTNLPGATSTSFSITNVQAVHGGDYSVVVTNDYGTNIATANLTVIPSMPVLTTQPVSQGVWIRSNAFFQVAAYGSEPFTYQWQFNGSNISGATNPSYSLSNLQQTNAGVYRVLVSNAYGTTDSSNAFLTVVTAAVVGWGNNTYGQFSPPPEALNPTALAAGDAIGLVLRSDSTVIGWGFGGYGEATPPPGLSNVIAIAAKGTESLALKSDRTVVAWGDNFYGATNVPPRLANVTAVSAGSGHNLALRTDGTVVAWGRDYEGQSDVPPGLNDVIAISGGGYHSLALKRDNTVVTWGNNPYGDNQPPVGLTNVVAISGGVNHSLALLRNGTVAAWGGNENGQTNVPAGLSNVVDIAAGVYHSLALKRDGTVAAWGYNTQGQASVPSDLSNIVAIAGGLYHSLAIVNDGSPWVMRPPRNQTIYTGVETQFETIGLGTSPLSYQWQFNGASIANATDSSFSLTNVQQPSAGNYSVVLSNIYGTATSSVATLTVLPPGPVIVTQPANQSALLGASATFAVTVTGRAPLGFQWRKNGLEIADATNASLTLSDVGLASLGNFDVVVSNAFGVVTSFVARLTFTQIVAWGDDTFSQTNVLAGLSNVVAVAAGSFHALALKNDGTVAAWGAGTNNLAAILDFGQVSPPANLSNVIAISAGGYHSLALRRDGSLAVWGNNLDGETNVPPMVTNVVAIAGGYDHCLALRQDRTVFAWGGNLYGQTNVPAGLTNVTAIAAGGYHNLALKRDGTVAAWGYNLNGAINVPAGLSNVMAIAGGGYHSVALLSNRTVIAWGRNVAGQSTIPAGLSNVVSISAGYQHTLAARADGTLIAWGWNNMGQTNFPAGLSNVVAVAGGAYHSIALLNYGAPFFATQPMNQTALFGQTATFSVSDWGTSPIYHQWLFNGTNVDGANNATLTLANVTWADGGNYQCFSSNVFGTVLSAPAVLSVLRNPSRFDTSPAAMILAGDGFHLTLTGLSGHGEIILYASSNLANWVALSTNSPQTGDVQFSDPDATNHSRRFYRAVEQ